jgi:hypothetical protein
MKPFALAAASGFSAFFSWFAANAGLISQVAGAIGAMLGCVLTIILIAINIPRLWQSWRSKGK